MVKRIFQGLIVFFALYAFVFVPLGKKTALEHLRAIFGTPQAREAAAEVKGGVTRLVRRLESEARQSTEKVDRRLREHDADEPGAADPSDPVPERDEARVDDGSAPPRVPKLRAMSAEAPLAR